MMIFQGGWLLVATIGLLAGCDSLPKRNDNSRPLLTVGCTAEATSTAPCASMARTTCGGDARLRAIKSRVELPMTQSVGQTSAPRYDYQAIYECTVKP
jgi:hypothetical protein